MAARDRYDELAARRIARRFRLLYEEALADELADDPLVANMTDDEIATAVMRRMALSLSEEDQDALLRHALARIYDELEAELGGDE